MENLLKQIEELEERILGVRTLLDIAGMEKEAEELRETTSQPDFWNDRERAVETSKRLEELEKETGEWGLLSSSIKDLREFLEVAIKEGDASVEDGVKEQFLEIEKKFGKMEFMVLFSGKYDRENAILSIHAGTGGVDAQDWAEILERMFLRFAEKKGWDVEIADRTYGSEAGIKSMTMRIKGRYAYGWLKSESGVHRLVRISPFDAEAMRHTSFALVEVIPELQEVEDIEIKDEDIRIDVFRSSGPGGQSVNTTDSAVRIVHKATGIVVSCQTERSQHQNKETAMKILKSKLFKLQEEEREKEELKLRGEAQKAEWGKQIRSYVMQPYQMVKDHRTNFETSDIKSVLDGELDGFMEAYLREEKKR